MGLGWLGFGTRLVRVSLTLAEATALGVEVGVGRGVLFWTEEERSAMWVQMQEGIISKECDLGELILSGGGK